MLWLSKKITSHFQILLAMSIWGLLFNAYVITNEYIVGVYCLLCLMCTWIIIAIGVLSKIWMCNKTINEK
jgi:hypothetical protein